MATKNMTMHKNSLDNWHNEIHPNLRKRQLQVIKVMQRLARPVTARDIMSATGQTSNVIHPRLGELRDLKYINEVGDRKIGKRKYTIYKLTELGEKTDTSQTPSLEPKEKYYSKEDYKNLARKFYDDMQNRNPNDREYLERVYNDMKTTIAKVN